MDILLMALPDIVFIYPTKIITTPNLALSSLAANLDKRHNVKVADLVLKRKNVKGAIKEALDRTKPHIVGLSAMTFQYSTALKIAKFIKAVHSHIKIALGGYHATLMYKEITQSKDGAYFDLIFRGESDLSFNEAMTKLEDGEDLKSVDGLSFKKDGKFIHNKKRELENLDRIKLPDRNARLWNECNVLRVPFDLIESSRGCLLSCNFCNIRKMYGKSYRTYETQRVIKDIENAKKAGTGMLLFTDDNITADVGKFEHLLDEIITHGHNDIIYGVQASSTGIASSERLVQKMSRAGFAIVYLGMENASKQNLKALNKGDIVKKSEQAVKFLRRNNILVVAGLIIGNPDDDYDSIEKTIKFASDLKCDFEGIQFLVPYPKTEIRKKLAEGDLLVNKDNFNLYNGAFASANTRYLSHRQLEFIKFKLANKYFKKMEVGTFKAFLKRRTASLRLLRGGISLLPEMIGIFLLGKIRRIFSTEYKIFKKDKQKMLKLNEFNI